MKPRPARRSVIGPCTSTDPSNSHPETNPGCLEDVLKTVAARVRALTEASSSWLALMQSSRMAVFEITRFTKKGGPLTKQISLSEDGTLISDGSACVMTSGHARRRKIIGLANFASFISDLNSNQALALGSLRDELTDIVKVVPKRKLRRAKPGGKYDLISRTTEYLEYRAGSPTLVLIDIDTKGMPQAVRDRVAELGGYVPALISVLPAMATAGYVIRSSTSSGLRRADTGKPIPGSDGVHIFVLIKDGADAERFLRDLHERCVLGGIGWCRADAAGRLLNRSIVDRMVARPERLVFEGTPILDVSLIQDEDARRPIVVDGDILDSVTACPPLSAEEQALLSDLRAQEAERLADQCAAARRAFIKRRARRLLKRNPGITRAAAEKAVERQIAGVLLPTVQLDFVDEALAGTTVGDVLADPDRYAGEKLADPIEGRRYDRDCAYVNLRSDGSPWIYSFAHGETIYALKFDTAAIEQAIEDAEAEDAAEVFVKLMMLADEIDPIDVERLKNLASKRSGIGPRALTASLKKARADAHRARQSDNRESESSRGKISLKDFYANLEMHNYIYTPTGKMWPGASVDARIPPQKLAVGGKPVLDEDGNAIMIPAHLWLDKDRAVEQITWAPGLPMIIREKYLIDGGWVDRPNALCFNFYRPPAVVPGDASDVDRWLDHLLYVYPDDADHIINWLAHRVQRPEEKINHALVFGGSQGIGKDTILEPVRYAIGPWNFKEASPKQVLGRFNAYVKSVILRINEARDLGEFDRFAFYDHTKSYIAAPPDTLLVDEKHLREYYIPNTCGVIISTNHKTNGIFLSAEDRRHHVSWSERMMEDERYQNDYFKRLWKWYADGGLQNVAAYLKQRDISKFDPKAPPPKTPAFWAIVDANRAPEEPELADALDRIGRPSVITLSDLDDGEMDSELSLWLTDRGSRRVIPYRLEKVGYVPVRNPDAKDGLWVIAGKRQSIYAKAELAPNEQVVAARKRRDRKAKSI
jgi:hypothetical protein